MYKTTLESGTAPVIGLNVRWPRPGRMWVADGQSIQYPTHRNVCNLRVQTAFHRIYIGSRYNMNLAEYNLSEH